MYLHGRGKISKLMNGFLHEFLDMTPAMILQSKYCFTVGGIMPKNYSVFPYELEIGKIN
jgi:hypothetical protein